MKDIRHKIITIIHIFPFMEQTSFGFDNVRLAPNEQIGLHTQDTWEISYVRIGSGMRFIGTTTEPFQSGEVIMIPPEIPHCWYFDKNTTDNQGQIANITVIFSDVFLRNCSVAFPELTEAIERLKAKRDAVKFGKEKGNAAIHLLEEMCSQNRAERVASMIRLILLAAMNDEECVVGRYQRISKEQQRMSQVRIYIICNAGRTITLDDVAHHAGMNRAAFCVFFKKAFGTTFINYLNGYRIELACQLLAQRQKSVSEICYQVGFNNVPYFNRVFKRLKGVSPMEYITPI